MLGLTQQELWGSVIFMCVVGLIYFGRAILDAERAADSVKPFKMGMPQRRSVEEPVWLSHPVLGGFTALVVLFVLRVVL